MKNIFIGNLTTKVGNDDLKEIFEEYGNVSSAKVIMDHYTGKSRGFGFVEMLNDEEAENAIRGLNGAELDGKKSQ
ncbi:MAG: RNA-binding protein [Bacteroidales bacterium]|jgi:RNA recognition motif-containing protein|nr:RNA-binding protein [Bacteroidales bacterium]